MDKSVWRDGWLWAIAVGRVFAYANFMVYAACLPVLRAEWGLSGAEAGSISAAFMFGYAVSLLAFSWLAERLGAKRVFVFSAAASAAAALAFAFLARGYLSALVLYASVALFQGGLYTPGIMLLAERYGAKRRGAAVGALIGSTSLGYAASLAVAGLMLPIGGYRLAFVATGLVCVLGTAVLLAVMKGVPNTVHARPEGVRAPEALWRNAPARRLILGYTWHNWELLGMWSWAPAFLAASLAIAGHAAVAAAEVGSYLIAVMHLVGALASQSMGHLSDRLGRRVVLVALAGIAAALSLGMGWLVAWPIAVLVPLMLVYGFAAIGDSPVMSAALTESVPPAFLGSALAVRSFLGFTTGAISPLVFGYVLDLSNPPGAAPTLWGPAFMALALGGLLATWCAWRFRPAGS